MTVDLPSPEEHQTLRAVRLQAQQLARPATSVADVVRRLVGLQAQDTRMARLLVRPRSSGLDAATVDRACAGERTVIRTWAMRGTLHMVAREDIRWIIDLLGPVFIARSRGRRQQLGLDDELCERGVAAIAEVLAGDEPLTRPDLVRKIAARGVGIDPRSQAPAHLVAYAAMRGVICRGPDIERDVPTYVMLDAWAGAQRRLEPDAALAELAARYATGYGSADVADFAAWSGLPIREARRGLDLDAGDRRDTDTEPVEPESPHVRLLGHFDPYLLGYRDRAFALDERFAGRVQRGGGFLRPTVVVDGRVVGTWQQRHTDRRITVAVEPFETAGAEAIPGLEAEVADIGRYLGLDATLAS